MIMVKARLLAKCKHTLIFRGGVGQEMEVENIKNWKYIGFSIEFSRVHGYATDMTWICQLVRTYCVGMPSNANSSEPPRSLLQGIAPFCSKPKTTLLLPRFKKTVSITLSLCTPRRCIAGDGVKLRSFLTLTIYGREQFAPRLGRFIRGTVKTVVSSMKPAWLKKKKKLLPYRKSDHKPSGAPPVAQSLCLLS